MRAALVAINARFTHTNLAVRYLQSSAAAGGFDTEIFEFTINTPPSGMLAQLAPENFDVICLSVYIWNARQTSRLIEDVRRTNPRVLIVLGGPEVTYRAHEWLASKAAPDFIIKGPGEAAFTFLLERDFAHGEKIVSLPNPPFEKMPSPYPDGISAHDLKRYIYYESSRGCPFSCAYCLSAAGGQTPEFKSASMVMDELGPVLAARPMAVKFVDRTFNALPARARQIWASLLSSDTGCTVFHFEINPLLLTDTDIDLLKTVPPEKFRFEIGVQSLNPKALTAVNRHGAWDQAEPAVAALINETSVRVHLDLIAGLPLEDMQSFAAGFNRLFALRPDHLQPGILKLLPGTPLREKADEYRMTFDPEPPYTISSNLWLTADELSMISRAADMTERIYNSGKFTLTVENLLKRFASPWDLFRGLAECASPDSTEGPLMNGNEIILKLAGLRFSDELPFIRDCLRWDWMRRSPEARYPRALKQEDLALRRKIFFTLAAKEEKILPQGLAMADGSKKIFFPESEMFQSMYMGGKGAAVFGIPGSLPVAV